MERVKITVVGEGILFEEEAASTPYAAADNNLFTPRQIIYLLQGHNWKPLQKLEHMNYQSFVFRPRRRFFLGFT
jgi:hypothetical protein